MDPSTEPRSAPMAALLPTIPPPEISPKGSEKRSPKIPPGFWPQISGVPDNFPRKCSGNPCNVVESQQKWSSYEVNSRILDNNYLRWYLFYLNKRTKDSTARTLPQEVSINSIDLAILFSYRNFCQCSVLHGFVTLSPNPCHLSPNAFLAMYFFSQQNQQLLFYLYLFTIFPWQIIYIEK